MIHSPCYSADSGRGVPGVPFTTISMLGPADLLGSLASLILMISFADGIAMPITIINGMTVQVISVLMLLWKVPCFALLDFLNEKIE